MNKKNIILMLKFSVSGGLIWFLLENIDLGTASVRIFNADLKILALVLVLSIIQILICVVRWRSVLVAIGSFLSFGNSLRLHLIGFFFNQALPSSVGGDPVRVYCAYKEGLSLKNSINGVILERVVTVIGLIILVVLATPFFIDRVGLAEEDLILLVVFLLSTTGIFGLVILMHLDRLPQKMTQWRFIKILVVLAADARGVFLNSINCVKVLGWSSVGHINIALLVYLLGVSIELEITWVDCMVLMPPVLLFMTIPISIAGWGVREHAMVSAFSLIGVSGEGALALSIMFGLVSLFMGLPGGIVWLLRTDKKIKSLEEFS